MIMNKIPVIIDTDIGDDIDDAVALCLAMRSPQIRLLGVTTVFKNTRARASIAKRFLRLGGMEEVPVAAGASVPLSNPKMFGKVNNFAELPVTYKEEYYEELNEELTARELIIRLLTQSSEPVTIVTLGALTNIADVLRERPQLKQKIRQLHIMGGAYYINWTEYNFACDPEAADMVLSSGLPIKAVGIDVTLRCVPTKEQMEKMASHSHPCIQMLMEMCRSWSERGMIALHDPLALWSVFEEEILTFERQVYRVETRAEYARGICVKLSDHNWKISPGAAQLYVAKDVDSQRFTAACIERVLSFSQEGKDG